MKENKKWWPTEQNVTQVLSKDQGALFSVFGFHEKALYPQNKSPFLELDLSLATQRARPAPWSGCYSIYWIRHYFSALILLLKFELLCFCSCCFLAFQFCIFKTNGAPGFSFHNTLTAHKSPSISNIPSVCSDSWSYSWPSWTVHFNIILDARQCIQKLEGNSCQCPGLPARTVRVQNTALGMKHLHHIPWHWNQRRLRPQTFLCWAFGSPGALAQATGRGLPCFSNLHQFVNSFA